MLENQSVEAETDSESTSTPSAQTSAPAFVSELSQVKPLEWMAVAGGLVLALAFWWLDSIFTSKAEDRLDTQYFELHSAAIAAALTALVAYALLTSAGWRHLAGVSGQWVPQGLRRSVVVVVACLVPLIAIRASQWDTPLRVLAVSLENIAGALMAEFVFRGVVLVFIASALAKHRYGVLWAAVATALIDAAVGGGGSLVVVGFVSSLCLTAVVLECRSIWPAVVLHALLNLFVDIPFDAQGMPGSSGWKTVSLLLLAAGAGFALKRLSDAAQPCTALMSANVAPIEPAYTSFNPLG